MYVRVYHITAFENLSSILAKGIYCRSYMEQHGSFHDIAEHGALNNHRYATIDGRPIESFARCFFNPLPPMYYNKEKSEKLCVIELNVPVVVVNKYGNTYHNLKIDEARWPYPRIYKESISSHRGNLEEIEVHNLNDVHWNSSPEAYNVNPLKTKAKRGAEIAVFNHIPPKYIKRVYKTQSEIESLEKYRDLGKPQIIGGCND